MKPTTETLVKIVILFAILFIITLSINIRSWGSEKDPPSAAAVRKQIHITQQTLDDIAKLPLPKTAEEEQWIEDLVKYLQQQIDVLEGLLDMIETETLYVQQHWYLYQYGGQAIGGHQHKHSGVGGFGSGNQDHPSPKVRNEAVYQ